MTSCKSFGRRSSKFLEVHSGDFYLMPFWLYLIIELLKKIPASIIVLHFLSNGFIEVQPAGNG